MIKYLSFIVIYWLSILLAPQALEAQVDSKALDKYFSKAQQAWNIPGLAIGIIKDGELVLSKGYGQLQVNKKAKVDGHSLFAIASNTKAFISTAIAMLVEEGKLDWDDPVRKYLPYFELYGSYVSQHTSIRDLLCHRVGLGTYSGDVLWYKISNVATPHKPVAAQNIPIPYAKWDNMGAAGGIISSADDMLKWIQLQIEGGTFEGKKIFSQQSQQEFWTPHNNRKVSKVASERYPGHCDSDQ